MKINQLSARIDEQLANIDSRLAQLNDSNKEATTHTGSENDRIALQRVREKLVKSKDIAWRAHNLQQQEGMHRQLRRTNFIGLGLCLFSLLAIVLLIAAYLFTA